MRNALVCCLVLCAMVSLHAQFQIPTSDNTKQQMLVLIQSHPDRKLAADMMGWYSQGKFQIVVEPVPAFMSWNLVPDPARPGTRVPAMHLDPRFFQVTLIPPEERRDPRAVGMQRYGALVHEYLHLANHLNGKYSFDYPADAPPSAQASYIWNAEFESTLGEWQFLRQRGYAYTLIKPQFRKMPEWEGFVRTVNEHMRNRADYQKYKQYYEKYFQDALARPR